MSLPEKQYAYVPDLDAELVFQSSKSGGKGGQHVNKTESRIELIFNVDESEILSADQKLILQEKAANKLTAAGELRITCESSRSQLQNKEEAISKFYELLNSLLKPVRKRKPTRVPKSVKRKRVESKKRRSETKQNRKRPEI